MLPKIWGESGWDFIHFVTLGYPENPTAEDRQRYYQYFTDLQYVLPCDKCRKNMAEHLKQLPLNDQVLANRESLVKWGIDLHNIVNYYTGKPILTYEQAMKEINDKMKAKESGKRQNNLWLYLIILLAIIIIIYLVFLLFTKKKST
jgi:hypothetical protein